MYNFSAQRKICLKHVPDITFTLNIYDIFAMYITYALKIYDIVIQYKEIIFETYARYSLYFKDIWYNCSKQRNDCLKHIPDITFALNIHDIFAMYARWNIYTNQMKVKNYTSWNIETKPMTLLTYTSRCSKLYLKLSTLPTCSNGWNQGVAHCMKVWGSCYFSLLSGRDSLVPLELACEGDT